MEPEADNPPWLRAFCPLEFGIREPDNCLFHVIPAPLERSVSYGSGASRGPEAILRAAEELEPVYLGAQPGEAGGFVHPFLDCSANRPVPEVLRDLADQTRDCLTQGRVPIILGGEHTVTLGAVTGALEALRGVTAGGLRGGDVDVTTTAARLRGGEAAGDGVPGLGVLQLDAHADLRDSYNGDRYSHGSVMRRIHEQFGVPIHQLGIRGLAVEEVEYREAQGITFVDAPTLHRQGLPNPILPESFPANVYLTFDIDVLDASLMPATGTPSPGGLFWHQIEGILELVYQSGRRLVGFDVVELAPMAGFHSADFIGAVAVYAGMHAVLASRGAL